MKTLKTALLLSLCFAVSDGQSTFQKTYGGTGDEILRSIIQTTDGGYVAAGYSNSCNADNDLFLFKTDSLGKMLWAKDFGDPGDEWGWKVLQTTDGGLIFVGRSQVSGHDYDAVIVRTDSAGNILWKKTYGGYNYEAAHDILPIAGSNDYLVLGVTNSYGAGGYDCSLMRINESGNVVWVKTYGTSTTDWPYKVIQDSNGNFLVGADLWNGTVHDLLLIKTDSTGNLLWSKKYATGWEYPAYGLREGLNDDYIVLVDAQPSEYNIAENNIALLRISGSGQLLWAKTYDAGVSAKTADVPYELKILDKGNIVITGRWGGSDYFTGGKALLLKVDSTGNFIWGRTYGKESSVGYDVSMTPDNGFMIGGYTNGQGRGGYDALLIRTDANGIVDSTTTSITPVVTTPTIDTSSMSLMTTSVSLTAQDGQFARDGEACFGPPPPFRILSVSDVPNDQGKQVFVVWTTLKNDSTAPFVVSQYHVWRMDNGVWSHVAEVPPRNDSVLSVVVPTLVDSTMVNGMYWTRFQVTAHGSDVSQIVYTQPAQGYSVDNLAPMPPQGVLGKISGQNFVLTWNPATEKDFHYVAVYRSTFSGFSPQGMTPYATVGGTQFTDAVVNGQKFYYRIAAVDFSGNESKFSPEISASINGVDVSDGLPTEFALSQNYPNPFNPSTKISYSVPKTVHVTLKVYDVLGREVVTLVNGIVMQGTYEATFDGSRFASGVYLYRLQAGPYVQTRRFMLQK